jgi:hypothetical protein
MFFFLSCSNSNTFVLSFTVTLSVLSWSIAHTSSLYQTIIYFELAITLFSLSFQLQILTCLFSYLQLSVPVYPKLLTLHNSLQHLQFLELLLVYDHVINLTFYLFCSSTPLTTQCYP